MEFRLLGVPIRMGFSFFFITTLLLLADTTGTVLFVLSAVLIHELGHLAAMALLGAPVQLLDFSPFGLKIYRGDRLLSYPCEAVISLAGAGANLLAAAALRTLAGDSFATLYLSAVNLAVGVFHLLPIRGLDGGKVAADLLALHMSAGAARNAAGVLSLCFLGMLCMLATHLFLQGGANISLLIFLFYLGGAYGKG